MIDYDFNCHHNNDSVLCIECKQELNEWMNEVSKRCGHATKSGNACQQWIALDAIACHIHSN